MQLDFFSKDDFLFPNSTVEIEGLVYIDNFITLDEEKELIEIINNLSWLNELSRRVQHYGYRYDYKRRIIDNSLKIGALPFWMSKLAVRLFEQGHIDEIPDQVIINEYLPGQGITDHIDCEPCFGNTIISLSLASPVNMIFTNVLDTNYTISQKINLLLMPRSIVILSKNARYNWKHGIKANKRYEMNGRLFQRETRLSLTFRKVKFSNHD